MEPSWQGGRRHHDGSLDAGHTVVDPTDPTGKLTGVVAVVGSLAHALALLDDGTVKAWGRNDYGQLGNGASSDSHVPVVVADPSDPSGSLSGVRAVAGGWWHSAALLDDGSVRTWGNNGYGQLGDGTWTDSLVPVAVLDPSDPTGMLGAVVAISVRGSFTLALKADGTVRSWGQNTKGQLGNGSTQNKYLPVWVADPTEPSGFLQGVAAISAGYEHSTAVILDGTVRSWGGNNYGELGTGTCGSSPLPVRVIDPSDPTGFLTGVVAVDSNQYFTLAQK